MPVGSRIKVFWVEPSDHWQVTQYRGGVEEYRIRCDAAEYKRLFDEPLPDEPNSHRSGEHFFKLPDGTEVTDRELPPGALRNNEFFCDIPDWCGADGMSLVVRLPNGHDWNIDSQANNCTKPQDKVHRCWVRTGDPKTGNLHVCKEGNTSDAGAGSIMSGNYHGFLHRGYLVEIP